jgi:hypothetical protein
VELYQHTHQTCSRYKKIKEVTSGTSLATKCNIIKDKTGVVLEDDMCKRCAEYCEELYNYVIKPGEYVLIPLWSGQHQEPECTITLDETEEAIKKLQLMKAPGVDGMCDELIKYEGDAALQGIHNVCQQAWTKKKFLQLWTKSIIFIIPKKAISNCVKTITQSVLLLIHAKFCLASFDHG